MTEITDERREQLRLAGKKGGHRRWIKHPRTPGIFDKAHDVQRRSFEQGHGCKACGDYIAVDPTLSDADRRLVGERLRRLHYSNLAQRSAATRRAQ